jgi:folate-binding protein YgfZ
MPSLSALPTSASPAGTPSAVYCTSPGLGLLSFAGPDAEAFLQGQLSNDLKALVPGGAQLSSYNSPKGRMLATLVLWRDGADGFRALVADDIAEATAKRLAMFVLRSKLTVADLSPSYALVGIAGAGARDAARAATGSAPAAGHVDVGAEATTIALPDGRIVVAAASAHAEAVRTRLAHEGAEVPAATWRWFGIRAGIPMIGAATKDMFVPQTANWDVLDGVSFHKGCYTGQEIIARTHYLGRLKERMQLFHADAPPPPPGAKVFGAMFGDQACGAVVEAAPSPDGGSDLLAVVQLSALDGGLYVGAPDGPMLAPLALPYALPAATAPNRPRV